VQISNSLLILGGRKPTIGRNDVNVIESCAHVIINNESGNKDYPHAN
jgi:hypothetical protein